MTSTGAWPVNENHSKNVWWLLWRLSVGWETQRWLRGRKWQILSSYATFIIKVFNLPQTHDRVSQDQLKHTWGNILDTLQTVNPALGNLHCLSLNVFMGLQKNDLSVSVGKLFFLLPESWIHLWNVSYLMCVKTRCSVRRPYEAVCPTIPGFIKPAINQGLIKRLGHSWREWTMVEN